MIDAAQIPSPQHVADHAQRLAGLRDEVQREYDRVRQRVAEAKGREALQPLIKEELEMLQQQENERAVGAFERLLSALLRDVLPGERQVVMELSMEAGAPALDFFIRKGDNPLEDALRGTGGSVTNILSAGLLLISLIRSGRRRFLVLDEADCWIRPTWIPGFARVIQQMSQRLGVQVLMISHHDENLFEAIPHRLHLERNDTGLSAMWSSTSETPTWQDDDEGIRSIYLENTFSHQHTFLPLSPFVTLFTGDNDAGKSAVVQALRSVFYKGLSNDKMIHHGTNVSKVVIDFGQQRALFWERRISGKPKMSWTLTDATHPLAEPLHRSESAKDFPAWLEAETGMGLIDGLDVQLRDQQDPIFLLNKPASQRARALCIGSDSGYVERMIGLSKEDWTAARNTIKQGERDLELMHRRLNLLAPLSAHDEALQALRANHQALLARLDQRAQRQTLMARWGRAQARRDALTTMPARSAPQVPDLLSTPALVALVARWSRAQSRRHTLLALRERSAPTLRALLASLEASTLIGRWQRAHTMRQVLRRLRDRPAPSIPPMPGSAAWQHLLQRWRLASLKRTVLAQALHAHPVPASPALDFDRTEARRRLVAAWRRAGQAVQRLTQSVQEAIVAEQRHQQTMNELFPCCPLCARPWDTDASHAHPVAGEAT